MKKKLRLPILLLAVVIMLSIFYVKEAQNDLDTPTGGSDLQTSTLNPDFTEARLLSISEVNTQIEEYEVSIASGSLNASEVLEATAKIAELRELKHQEVSLEETIIELNQYDDVLVLLGEDYLVIDIYTEEDVAVSQFIEMAKLAKETFGNDCKIKVKTTNKDE